MCTVYCVQCLLFIVQMCIFCKVCILLFMHIVNVSYLVTCTAMAQSLVPNNFTIIKLVYMMCDNKEILFDVLLYSHNNLSLLSMT